MNRNSANSKHSNDGRGAATAKADKNTNPCFVYGTLMRGERAEVLLTGARYVGDAALRDYAVYDLGPFPGILPCEGGKAVGELWYVDEATLRALDRYEGEGTLYRRERVTVETESGGTEAYAYVYMLPVSGRPVRGRWHAAD